MKKIESKLEKISQFEQLLLSHPEGLTRAETARRLGVHRSTVSRYLTDTAHILPIWEEGTRIYINRDKYLNNVKLTIHEIMALHIAVRLFACRTDKHNPHACSAIRKIGNAIDHYSEVMSDYILATAEHIEKQPGKYDKSFVTILEELTGAMCCGRRIRARYYSAREREIHEYDFEPYFIQPYAAGFTLYTIGYCIQKEQVITLKVERIKHIAVTDVHFTIPESFRPEKLLKDAWGIWYSNGEPVEVVLEFSPDVSHRVAETVWHKSQKTEQRPDGSLVWRAEIAEPLELFPWIRGWGSDVEIVKPDTLRSKMKEEVRKMGKMYE
ncbi:MAG: WYL domain-containing transcriptional regulator [Bacteroidales bacterium]|nr:WYL domain-containing transcriptional regulator [Bacteroidales bacterium]